ncbi:hypothetical protein PPTG_24281 [Phytophthora nicotianae INRA-310]|uniref:Uncharacterized protein n=1 Tax=Phytophthora nicotianae (strain INRA-310) TaxID=761204 RepID=W2PI68_PHYN3|nr:hypothetical protein PPTG_24281 [Phytophthora nicotianae INRA-310]ETN00316.1 hypothetical protein PPTG_24281 [Phytophthora nicotianae INRA-310]
MTRLQSVAGRSSICKRSHQNVKPQCKSAHPFDVMPTISQVKHDGSRC